MTSLPDIYTGVAFNADPNDPVAAPSWSDLSVQTRNFKTSRGRNYELDQNSGTASVRWRDVNEDLNPANPSSPYSPNVVPYRQVMFRLMYPVLGTGNLLNSLAFIGYGIDPTFESYTAPGPAPSWVTAVGAVTPTVTTTNPQQGTKDLTYAVANGAAAQGVKVTVPCIPGRQYTASAFVRQSSASTQLLQVADQNLVLDQFNRTTANGWGTADLGGAWTTAGGAASDFSTAPGTASHAQTTLSAVRATVAGSALDVNVCATITAPVIATGDLYSPGLLARWANINNYFLGDLEFNTDRTITVRVVKTVAGVGTQLAAATLPFTYTAGTKVNLRFEVRGNVARTKAWLYGTPEPTAYNVTATDASLTAAGAVGCRTFTGSGSTNAGLVLSISDFAVIGSVTGSTTTTTGAYVRLAVTWTATQPTHDVQVATTGTAVAGTVNVDALQHEPGGSASTFTTAGPFIRPVWTGYVERWTRGWDAAGFVGVVNAPCVDVLAVLGGQPLNTELVNAYLALVPDYYWPLWEDAGALSFADATGNNNPPLVFYRPDLLPLPTAGASPSIIGDPQGGGVEFQPSPLDPFGGHADLATGPALLIGTQPVAVPVTIGTSWAVTFAVWAKLTNPGTGDYSSTLIELGRGTGPSNFDAIFAIFLGNQAAFNLLAYANGASVVSTPSTPVANYLDDANHCVVGVVTQNNTNTVLTLYIDGAQVGTLTVGTGTVGGILPSPANTVVVGEAAVGIESHVGIWNRALTALEISTLNSAGATGKSGETSGARIARYLAAAYVGPTAIDTGMSTMGPSTVVRRLSALDASQDITTTENGDFFGAADRTPTFLSRSRRYTTQTAAYVFGENVAGGELPYLGDIQFDIDPHYIANDIVVTKANGVRVQVENAASGKRYFPKDLQRNTNPQSDLEVYDAANWLLAIRKDPQLRCARITFDPASNPSLWPMCLSIEKGTRVTVKRRAKAGNAGAGATMSVDFWVEAIDHQVDRDAGTWITGLQLTPVFTIAGVSAPWILDDVNRSVLGNTTIPGW